MEVGSSMPKLSRDQKMQLRLKYIYEHGFDDPMSKMFMTLLRGKYKMRVGMQPLKHVISLDPLNGYKMGELKSE